jgi:hypothetical protein
MRPGYERFERLTATPSASGRFAIFTSTEVEVC